ncbi:amidohydrolase [Glaciihabitans sp. dw_435]|uniref:amidohydrolase family protein n=1 Tax=Glaciihabitans sp. dw_435 TaxID=2720081 RepID=UPI001BD58AAE|nr:amidohydrolase [Glaciihabitans sp. dw_435]
MSAAVFVSADEVWLGGWRGASLLRIDGNRLDWVAPLAAATERPTFHVPGTIFGGFTDSHVHLGLIDPDLLVAGGIARVVDLGGDPESIVALRDRGRVDASAVAIEFAGAFLTAPGGYPSDRSWAPRSSLREVATPQQSGAAIGELRGLGATRIKITLNSNAGPVWDDGMLAAVVTQAHAVGLPVVAHAEGPGQAQRAARSGVDTLAHTPWTERLSDDDVAHLAATLAITSTLDIHGYGDYGADYATALDNLTRFVAAGGRVLYGTDLGNGPLPTGLNERELVGLAAAGLDAAGIAAAVVPDVTSLDTRISWIPNISTDPAATASWFASSTVLAVASLKELFA